jgi:hypothetical protein
LVLHASQGYLSIPTSSSRLKTKTANLVEINCQKLRTKYSVQSSSCFHMTANK